MQLFVRNISKDVTKDTIKNIFEQHGFGTIKEIIYPLGKRNADFQNAIVLYNSWDLENTECTRSILESGRHLSIYSSEDTLPWTVVQYGDGNDPVIVFPDILLPNVTDNRAHRQSIRYDMQPSLDVIHIDSIINSTKNKKTASISKDILESIRMKLRFNE